MNNKIDEEKLHLQELFEEVQQNQDSDDKEFIEKTSQPKIDVLNLPPRKEIHKDNKQRVKFKISTPLIRFILVITALIIILASSYYFWGDDLLSILNQL